MKSRTTHLLSLRTLIVVMGVLALALFTQLAVSRAEPLAPDGASTLGDFVWHDANADGVKDGAEWGAEGIDGVVVKLYQDDLDGTFEPGAGDTFVATLTTGDDSSTTSTTEQGWYDFVNITANGTPYWVEIADSNFDPGHALEGYVYTGNLAGNDYNGEEPRLVYMGDPIMDYNGADFPYALPGIELVKTAGNAVDGATEYINSGDAVVYHYTVTNTGETYLSNIVITDDNGTPGDTNDNFTACTIPGPLAPGASDSCDYTVQNVTDDVTNTAKATGNPTDSAGTDLPGDDVSDTDDAIVQLYASLGDYVWEDLNADGVQDGEPGIANVEVNLLDSSGTQIATTTTDANGAYSFDDLVPGDYAVEFTLPSGYVFSPKDASGDDATDSDADTTTGKTINTTLTSGENDLTWDAGMYQKASLGNFVWDDLNADGVQDGEPPIEGATVNLYKDVNGNGVAEPGGADGSAIATDTTDSNGIYGFDNLTPGAYFVEFVKPTGFDKASPSTPSTTSDPNDSDAGETTGLTDVTILVSGENDPTWDAGFYKLASLGDFVWDDTNADGVQDAGEPGVDGVTVELFKSDGTSMDTTTTANGGAYSFTDLVPGDYAVQFTLPSGYVFSPQDQGGDDATDSDADTTTGKTINTTLTSGENDPTWDAGMYKPASLGDFVWDDLNADGVQDATNEPPIEGATVNLYKDVNGNGVAEPGGADGSAIATDTTDASGIYGFDDLTPGAYFVEFVKPAGFDKASPSTPGTASDATDSDADETTGLTDVTVLVSGEIDPTWDAGFYKLASIGDFVWWDLDEDGVQDVGEPGIQGVTVTLKDANGNTVGTTTDANGAYSFTDLEPGDYTVVFTLPGSDWSFSPQDRGNDDAVDSDADVNTGETDSVNLTSGENDDTVDAGMSIPSSYTITKENTTTDTELVPGDAVEFTITIKNTGKTWIAVLPLRDTYDKDYLTYVDANPASSNNDDDGIIDWSDLTVSFGQDLAPGASISVVVNFTAKATTEGQPNNQTINTATAHDVVVDPDGPSGPNGNIGSLPDQSDQAPVSILNPVGEPMGGFSAAVVEGNTVRVRWQSASEANILGFNVLRKAHGRFERVNDSLIFARNAGADAGAGYNFVDSGVATGHYTYALEIVRLDGGVERYGSASVDVGRFTLVGEPVIQPPTK